MRWREHGVTGGNPQRNAGQWHLDPIDPPVVKMKGVMASFINTLSQIESGYPGTVSTIMAMGDQAAVGALNLQVRSLAESIVRGVPNKDYLGEAEAVFKWVKQRVRYVRDPANAERVATPFHTLLVSGQGDCDDHATSIAALMLSLGHQVEFVTVGVDPRRPDRFSHVYPRIKVGDAWLGADTTVRQSYLGWEPPAERVTVKRRWPVLFRQGLGDDFAARARALQEVQRRITDLQTPDPHGFDEMMRYSSQARRRRELWGLREQEALLRLQQREAGMGLRRAVGRP